jgi:hypothetical protein
MGSDLNQAKLEKEVEKLNAEVEKLRAETADLTTKQSGFRRSIERGAAILIALGGFATAFGTCHRAAIDEKVAELAKTQAGLAKTQADLEKTKADEEIERAKAQSAVAVAEEKQVSEKLRAARQTLAEVQADFERVAKTTATLKEGSPTKKTQLTQAVQDLGVRLEKASETVALGTVLVFPAVAAQAEVSESVRSALAGQNFRTIMKAPLKRLDHAPQQTEVRYFRDADRASARRIVDTMRGLGQSAATSLVDDPDINFPRYFEIHYAEKPRLVGSSP